MKKLLSNYLFTVMYQLLLLITPFITTPYVSRILKPEGIGIDAYVTSMVQLFTVFITLNLPLYGSRQIASKQNQTQVSKEFWSIFSFQLFMSALNIIVYLGFTGLYAQYKALFFIHIFTLLAYSIDISWYFFGKEQIKRVSIRNMLVKIAGIILIFSFVKDYDDLNMYIAINAGTLFLGQLVMWIPLFREISLVKITFKDVVHHTKPILVLFLPQIMIQVYSLVNKIILGNISGEVEVGFFNQAYKIIALALGIISSLGSVMLPRMASEFSRGNKEEMEKYVDFSLQFVLLITLPMTLGMMGIAPNFVSWFLGEGFYPVVQLLTIMSPVIFFVGLANVFGIQILIGTNQQNKYTIAVTTGAVIALIVNVLLIGSLASTATAIALLTAEATGALLQLYFTRNYFSFRKFFKMIFKYGLLAVILFLSVWVSGKIFNFPAVLLTFVQLLIGAAVYFIGLVLIKDSFIMKVFTVLKQRQMRRSK